MNMNIANRPKTEQHLRTIIDMTSGPVTLKNMLNRMQIIKDAAEVALKELEAAKREPGSL